ncbi:MAG: Hcp family type VI secretion system effector [Tepidisphaerales bacterium]
MAVDYFLKIDGIPGESLDAKHKDEIHIDSWSFGATQVGSSSQDLGLGSGKVNMQDFHFTMKANKASPLLFIACANGEHIKKAVLTCRKAGKTQQEFLIYTFTDLLISSFQTGGNASDVIPTDQISFNFTKVVKEYKPQKQDGSLDAGIKKGYNLKTNVEET